MTYVQRISKSGVNDSKSGGSEMLLKETQAINKSLSALSQVIMAMQQKAAHVPFRNSKLTYLLQVPYDVFSVYFNDDYDTIWDQHNVNSPSFQNSLGPKSRTLLVCNVNPLHANAHESLCTLRFAAAVSEVTTISTTAN